MSTLVIGYDHATGRKLSSMSSVYFVSYLKGKGLTVRVSSNGVYHIDSGEFSEVLPGLEDGYGYLSLIVVNSTQSGIEGKFSGTVDVLPNVGLDGERYTFEDVEPGTFTSFRASLIRGSFVQSTKLLGSEVTLTWLAGVRQ